ncbi:hypothetical protein F2Q69_00038072 [Brassica cretica]|uniref:Uncharacterized protein n=1 Tax=Brassica cretica TaxID=69181 RepID=A0A8S9SUC8_BRACR|nr:hypothetical protein F2Q69_00038072 [Brassica cretica]
MYDSRLRMITYQGGRVLVSGERCVVGSSSCQSALEIELDAKIDLCEDRPTWKSGYLDIELVAYWDNNCECVPQAVLKSMEIEFNSLMGEGDLSTFSIS